MEISYTKFLTFISFFSVILVVTVLIVSPAKQAISLHLRKINLYSQLSKTKENLLEEIQMVHQGLKRSFYLYTPSSYNSTSSMPLVIVFHGSGGTGSTIADITGFNELAEKEGFLVVYPNGINHLWHDARDRFNKNIDDISFTKKLIDDLKQTKNIDSRKIYAVGMSNGAVFTQTLACQLSNQIAAFATVAGSLPPALLSQCKSTKIVPILMINGTADPIVHYQGGLVGRQGKRGELVSIPETIDFWRNHNGCSSPKTLDAASNRVVQITRYICDAKPNSEVVLVTIKGGLHVWPGGLYANSSSTKVKSNKNKLNATKFIWDFFKRHTLL